MDNKYDPPPMPEQVYSQEGGDYTLFCIGKCELLIDKGYIEGEKMMTDKGRQMYHDLLKRFKSPDKNKVWWTIKSFDECSQMSNRELWALTSLIITVQ